MNRIEFITKVRFLAWCGYQMGADQRFNIHMNKDQYDSLMDGVRFLEENPAASAEENHENWLRKKTEQGWKWGPQKDFEKKEHPDMVPYNDLPFVEQKKDELDILIHREAGGLYSEILEGFSDIRVRSHYDIDHELDNLDPHGDEFTQGWITALNWVLYRIDEDEDGQYLKDEG